LSEAKSIPGVKMLEHLDVRSGREMTNGRMRIEVNENIDPAKSNEAETAKRAVGHSVHLDATTSEHSMLATDSLSSVDVKTIVVVKDRSSLIDLGATIVRKNSRTDRTLIVGIPMIARHSRIGVERVKVLEVQNDPAPDEKASVADQSLRNSGKAAPASAGQNLLVAERMHSVQTTAHDAEVPDTLSSSFCPS